MATWRVEKYITTYNLLDKNFDYSIIESDLDDFYDSESKMYKVKKSLNMSTYFSIYIGLDCRIDHFMIEITSLFNCTKYIFNVDEFSKVCKAMKEDEDENSIFNLVKSYFSSHEELSFINLLDDNDVKRETL